MIGRPEFWVRFLGGSAAAAARRPRGTLALALAAAALAAGSVAMRLELKSSNLDLLDPRLPEIVAFRAAAARFGTPNMLIAAFEGGDAAAREAAADRAAAAIRGLPGVARVLSRPPFNDDLLREFSQPSHFATRDGSVVYVFVQPADRESAATTIAPFVRAVREAVRRLDLERSGIRVAYTGLPQYAIDDRDVIQGDIARASTLSFLGVLAIYIAAFRGLRDPLLAMLVLAWAALVTAGVGAWVPGHLTLVSAAFFSILFGLGIDFGVHVLDVTEEYAAAGLPRHEALVAAVRRLAPALGTGAATTVLSFFVLLLSGFRGFAELGFLAGVGVLVALVAMVTVLPASLVILPPSRRVVRPLESRRSGAILGRLQQPLAAALLAVAAGAVILGGAPGFDGDYLDLQAAGSEAVRVERQMVRDSDVAPQAAVFTEASEDAADDLAWRLRDEPTVASVRNLGDFKTAATFGVSSRADWEDFRSLYVADDGARAVYAFPRGDIWDRPTREAFLAAMRRIDPRVTGMPVLADLFERRSIRALRVSSALAALLLVVLVAADLGRPVPALLALLPTVLAVAAMLGVQRLVGMPFNPLNLLALPVILGSSEDAGVHLVHRFLAEDGDMERTLAGAGRAILVSGLTTLLGFGSLAWAHHRGLASLARLLALGMGLSLLFTLFVLPSALRAVPRRWLHLPAREDTP